MSDKAPEKDGQFIQITAASIGKDYTLLYALDNNGVVWLYTEGKDSKRFWEPLEESREQPASRDN